MHMSHGADGSCPDTVHAALYTEASGVCCSRPLMMMNVWRDGVSTHKRKQNSSLVAVFSPMPFLLSGRQHVSLHLKSPLFALGFHCYAQRGKVYLKNVFDLL